MTASETATTGRFLAALACAASLLLASPGAARAQEKDGGGAPSTKGPELKFGTLAPDNTPWSDILKNFKKGLQKDTKGKLKVRLYLNGVLGDEAHMLELMKHGQLTGGGFSTGGISTRVPELQLFELPFLFDNDEEADYLMDEVVLEDMRKYCWDRGLYLYMWAVNGWVDLGHKKKPLLSVADLKGESVYMQQTDIQKAFWNAIGANAKALSTPDVLGALQSGMIDGYAATPIFASATQWFTQTRHWTDSNHIYQPAAVVFERGWWEGLDEATQKTIQGYAEGLQKSARKDVRGIDAELFEEFKKAGITVHPLSPEARKSFQTATEGVARELIGRNILPAALVEKAQKALAAYREKRKAGGGT
jgi:TRAP-type C4-dicarboxylate transport system substrate-binding protein